MLVFFMWELLMLAILVALTLWFLGHVYLSVWVSWGMALAHTAFSREKQIPADMSEASATELPAAPAAMDGSPIDMIGRRVRVRGLVKSMKVGHESDTVFTRVIHVLVA